MKKPDQKLTAKRIAIILILPIALNFLFYTPAVSEPTQANLNNETYTAEVTDISDSKYYPAVKKAIEEAKFEIYMVMYLVSLDPYDKSSPVYNLVNELARAQKRGVKVKAILDLRRRAQYKRI